MLNLARPRPYFTAVTFKIKSCPPTNPDHAREAGAGSAQNDQPGNRFFICEWAGKGSLHLKKRAKYGLKDRPEN